MKGIGDPMPDYVHFLFLRSGLCRCGVVLYEPDLAGQNFVVCLLSAVYVCVFRCPQSSDDMQRHAYTDAIYIWNLLAFPGHYVVPRGLGNSRSVPGLVKQVGGKRKVGYPHSVVLVGAYYAYASLELDPVDVFHKIFVLGLLLIVLPHILCALCRLLAK